MGSDLHYSLTFPEVWLSSFTFDLKVGLAHIALFSSTFVTAPLDLWQIDASIYKSPFNKC